MTPEFAQVDGLRVRFARGGQTTGRPVLLTSPWPQSIVAFRAIWPALAGEAPLVALDLPGFGQSESRPDVLNAPAMGDFLIKFIEQLKLEAPHGVCPDIGTAASLFAAATRKDLFTSLTVGGGAMDETLVAGTLKDIVQAPDTKAFEGVDGGELVAGSVVALSAKAPDDADLRDYRESYRGTRFVTSTAFVRDYPRSLPRLRQLLAQIETPVQVVYGKNDPLVPAGNAEVLARSLPHVRVVALESGHFAWQDTAAEYSAAVLDWIGGSYRSV
jgi:pimeloyl-ACP methyl ester carboxylesterase